MSTTTKSLIAPDPPEDIEAGKSKETMKLADVESDSVRERLRSSNLDDLEKAFNEMSGMESLDDTTASNDDRLPFIPVVQQAPMPQAAAYNNNGNANAPTIPLNFLQEQNNINVPDTQQDSSLSHNEEDRTASLDHTEEQKQESEMDAQSEMDSLMNQLFKKKVTQTVGPFEEEDDEEDEFDQIGKIRQDVDDEEQKIPLKQESFAPPKNVNEKEEEVTLRQERSVKFSLPTQKNMFEEEEEDDEEELPFHSRKDEIIDPFAPPKNGYSAPMQHNVIHDQYLRSSTADSYVSTPRREKEETPQMIVICGNELPRKTFFAFILLLAAAIGMIFAVTNPPKLPPVTGVEEPFDPCKPKMITTNGGTFKQVNSSVKCVYPTTSPAPTGSPVPTLSPSKPLNIYDAAYASARGLIVESEISPRNTLPKQCNLPSCSNGGKIGQKVSLQEKALNYLLSSDSIFFSWVNSNIIYTRVERVLQRYILTLMAFSLDSRNWKENNNWPVEEGNVAPKSVCSWYGITCDERSAYVNLKDFVDHTFLAKSEPGDREVEVTPMVTKIILRNNTLVGELPQEVFKLRHLEELKLHHNLLSGSIPRSIGLLSNMKKLWLHDTKNLSGQLPPTIGNMTALTSMWIGLNKFDGSIPTEIGRMTNLETIGFLANKFTGIIPPQILKLKKLQHLYLDMNKLSGPLPEDLGQLSQLKDIRVETNNLNGTLPSSLSELKLLKNFYAYENKFTGDLPNNLVVAWESLEKLELGSNGFTGTISSYLGQLPKLITLDLNNNNFESTIPPQICARSQLKKIDLHKNNIRGKIPDLSACTSLETLDLGDNTLTGTVPLFLRDSLDLQFLNLQGNKFVGTLPNGLCRDIPKCYT